MVKPKNQINVPGGAAMVVFIDLKGKVIDVTYNDGRPAEHGWGEKSATKAKTLDSNGIYVHGDSKLTCVTYQTPQGPRTV